MSDLTNFSDDLLHECIATCDTIIGQYEKKIANQTELRAEYIAELDRRTLESYWTTHPELTRVNEGDKILTTEYARQSGLCDTLGSVNTVKEFLVYRGMCGAMVHLDASWGEVFKPFEVISDMRRAYLTQQETE